MLAQSPTPTPAQIAAPRAVDSFTTGMCSGIPEGVGDDLWPEVAFGRTAGENCLFGLAVGHLLDDAEVGERDVGGGLLD